jgi:hypothetical protein
MSAGRRVGWDVDPDSGSARDWGGDDRIYGVDFPRGNPEWGLEMQSRMQKI